MMRQRRAGNKDASFLPMHGNEPIIPLRTKRRIRKKSSRRPWTCITIATVLMMIFVICGGVFLLTSSSSFFANDEPALPKQQQKPQQYQQKNKRKKNKQRNRKASPNHADTNVFRNALENLGHQLLFDNDQGVTTEFQGDFRCADGNGWGRQNDDYCDCFDGSDETATAACAHVQVQQAVFDCHDGSARLFASRVRDGVRDCSDGSDENDNHQQHFE